MQNFSTKISFKCLNFFSSPLKSPHLHEAAIFTTVVRQLSLNLASHLCLGISAECYEERDTLPRVYQPLSQY